MTVNVADMLHYFAQVNNDAGTNGGRMTAAPVPDNSFGLLFPDVSDEQRTAGVIQYRKQFHGIHNADNLGLPEARFFVGGATPGDDKLFILPGSQVDIQSDLTGSERVFGAAPLNINYVSGTVIQVLAEDWANYPFVQAGDKIAVHDGYYNVNDVWQPWTVIEWRDVVGAPSPAGDVVDITLDSALANTYDANLAHVCSAYEAGIIETSLDNIAITSVSGGFDDSLVVLNNTGTIEQRITVNFINATDFNVVGDVLGAIASGNRNSAFQWINPDWGVEGFNIPAGAWSGTYANLESVAFDIHPAAAPVWELRDVPAAAQTIAAFYRQLFWYGQS